MPSQSEQERQSQPKVWLTREGWIFLVILLFVSAGSLLRNINLLMLMTGIMVAPLFLSWRGCLLMLRQLTARRTLPQQLFAGQTVQATWKVTNGRQVLPTWALTVLDQWRRAEAPRKEVAGIRAVLPRVRPGETNYATYQIHFPQRGQFFAGPAKLTSRFPIGLVAARIDLPEEDPVLVAPALGRLTASWDRRLMSHASGAEAIKRRRGAQDEEFFGLRQYRSGDSQRHIHWRATARSGQLMVKQFDSRSDRDFVLLLDLWLPEGDDQWERGWAEQGLSFAATVMAGLSSVIRGKVAIGICGRESVVLCDINSPQFLAEVWNELAVAQPAVEPELVSVLERVSREISGGTPFYVVSTRPRPVHLQDLAGAAPHSGSLAAIEPWIRWLEIDSDEFTELFVLPESLNPDAAVQGES
ncbi:MAG: DUF58 domain-containing protein [Planctomycetota bacterium]